MNSGSFFELTMNPTDQTEYVAGVCNIGSQEIARRRNIGLASLVFSVLLLLVLLWTGSHPGWRLLVFFPAALSASGFLQARFHFCVGFARAGIYNFGPIGEKQEIVEDSAKAKDRSRGRQITLYAVLLGAAAAVAATVYF